MIPYGPRPHPLSSKVQTSKAERVRILGFGRVRSRPKPFSESPPPTSKANHKVLCSTSYLIPTLITCTVSSGTPGHDSSTMSVPTLYNFFYKYVKVASWRDKCSSETFIVGHNMMAASTLGHDLQYLECILELDYC